MIGFLRGILDGVAGDKITLDVSGVGYIVHCNERDKDGLGLIGEEVKILIHSITKEDGTLLYGFMNEARRAVFVELIKISGVSGKIGTAIMSRCSVSDIQNAVFTKEETVLMAVPGIGQKLASRIVNECKIDNISYLQSVDDSPLLGGLDKTDRGSDAPQKSGGKSAKGRSAGDEKFALMMQAVSGLTNIGIQHELAQRHVSEVVKDSPNSTLEAVIKESLARIYGGK